MELNRFPGHCTVGSPPVWWCRQGNGQAGGNSILLFSIGVWLRVVTQGCAEYASASRAGLWPRYGINICIHICVYVSFGLEGEERKAVDLFGCCWCGNTDLESP